MRTERAGWYWEHEDGTVDAHGVSVVVRDGVEHWALDHAVIWPESGETHITYQERRSRSLEVGKRMTMEELAALRERVNEEERD